MIRSKGANYIGATGRPRVRSLKTRITATVAAAAAILTIFAGVGTAALTIDSGTTKHVTAANAGLGLSCTTVIGGDMDTRSPWGSGPLSAPLFPELTNRSFTLSELIGSPAWTNYTGIGDGFTSDPFVKKYSDVINPLGLNGGALDDGTGKGSTPTTAGTLPELYSTNWAAVAPKLQAQRNTGTCFFGQTFVTNVANGAGLGLANAMQMFVSWVATSAFNSSFICDANTPASNCIDLVKIIGGRDDHAYQASGTDGGIIGNLTDSIYKPLIIIVIVVTALGVAWTGIVRRKFREALTQTAWLIFSFIIGLVLLLNPSMLAKAPMIATNAVTGCVIGAFNGVNCFDGTGFSSTTQPANLTADNGVCISQANTTSADQITALAVNSMGCTIWKTFILQNYAKGAFGVNLDQLEVNNPDTVAGEAAIKAGVSPDKFCYTLEATGSMASYDGNWLQTKNGGAKICNLAVYNILMQMKVTPAGMTASDVPAAYDPAWYNLIVTTASSDKMWPIWTNGGQQFMQGGVAVISVLLGGILIVVAAISALMYYITAIILLIFAPLFILVGTNPNRGKKIMLGWVETIISSILKYLASALFLLVSLTLYSAVLGSADPLAALLFVAILTVVLFMYRGDLVEMFGKVSLGGERMAHVMEKQIPLMGATGNQLRKKAGELPAAVIGGAVGGLMAGGISKMGQGTKIAVQNELRSAPGLVGRAAQAKERQLRDNKADFGRDAARAKEVAARSQQVSDGFQQDARGADNQVALAASNVETAQDELKRANEDLHQANTDRVNASDNETKLSAEFDMADLRAIQHQEIVNDVATSAAADGKISPAFAEFQKLSMSIQQLGANATIAEMGGNINLATTLRVEQQTAMSRKQELEAAGTNTPEGLAAWKNQGKEFDRQLKLEQSSHPELMDDSGNKLVPYSATEHVAAAKRAEDAKQASLAADITIAVALKSTDEAKETADRSIAILGDRTREAADIDAKAREAKINADALSANADAMHDEYQDLGPGNMPSQREMKNMKNKSFKKSEAVRESYETIDKIAAGEDLGAPTQTIAGAVAGLARDASSIATTGHSIDNRVQSTAEAQAVTNRNADSLAEAHDRAAAQKADADSAAVLASRERNAVKSDYTQKLADANEASRLEAEHKRAIEAEQKKVSVVDDAIASGKLVNGMNKEDSAKYLENVKKTLEEGVTETSKNAEVVMAKAEAAKAAAAEALNAVTQAEQRAKDAQTRFKQADKNFTDSRGTLAQAQADKAMYNNEAKRLADIQKKDAGVLTSDQVKLIDRPKNAEESERNKSLNKLVELADTLTKSVPANADANQIANLHAQISKLAKNVDKNPNANDGMINAVADAIAKLSTSRPSGLPKRPGAGPRFEEGE